MNTGNRPVRVPAAFRSQRPVATSWNPLDGTLLPSTGAITELVLAPYESRVILFSDGPAPASRAPAAVAEDLDLSHDWKVKIGPFPERNVPDLHSWAEDKATRYFSGEAVYEKTLNLPARLLQAGHSLWLNFGAGTPVQVRSSFGMQALLESPVREAAVVYLNGQLAGAVWCPPYEVNVTALVRAGENRIRVVVGNTAINAIAGQAPADYRAVKDRYHSDIPDHYYGDADLRHPLPSGLLGPLRLIAK